MSEDRSLKNKFFGKVAPYVFAGLTAIVPFGQASGQDVIQAKHTPPGSEEATEKLYSEKEAYRMSTKQGVIHYGEGIRGAQNEAASLSTSGFATVAIAGGPPGKVQIRVGRNPTTLIYTQKELDTGLVGHKVEILYRDRIGEPTPPSVAGNKKGEPHAALNLQQ